MVARHPHLPHRLQRRLLRDEDPVVLYSAVVASRSRRTVRWAVRHPHPLVRLGALGSRACTEQIARSLRHDQHCMIVGVQRSLDALAARGLGWDLYQHEHAHRSWQPVTYSYLRSLEMIR